MRIEYDAKIQDYICHSDTPLIKVTHVEPQADYTLKLTFSTGERKLYDMKPWLGKGVFAQLKNKALFMAAKLDGCTVMWTDEIDIDPKDLYAGGVPLNSVG
jgi:hypothetical protein